MIPYTQEDLDNAGVNDPTELEVFTYDTSTLTWEKIRVDSVDKGNSVLICTVDHFSMYTTGLTAGATAFAPPSDDGDVGDTGSGDTGGGGGGGGCFIDTASHDGGAVMLALSVLVSLSTIIGIASTFRTMRFRKS